MKRALIIIPFLLVVLLAVVLVAPGFMDWNQYKAQAQQQVKALTGLDMELAGNIGFTILPSPRFMAEKVSIKAPEGSKSETLASFDRLDVNVDLIPLLSRQVSVKYVTLVKPQINLEMLESGKLNAMTPEIESMTGAQGNNASSSTAAPPSVSLDKIVIDNGSFSYYDHKTKSETTIRNINADLIAKTLFGPYQASGSLFYQGNSLDFDLQTEKYDTKAQQLNPKLKLVLQPGDIELNYSGTLNLKDQVGGQGALSLNIPNVAKALEQNKVTGIRGLDVPLKVKGVLTADTEKADYRDFELSLGDDAFTGSFGAVLNPLRYALEIRTLNSVKIASLLPDLAMFKTGTFNLKIEGDSQTTKIHQSAIRLDDHEFTLSGSYTPVTKAGRALAVIDFTTALLDYDTLAKKMPASKGSSKADMESSLRAAALPFDMDLNLNAKKLKYQGQALENIGVKAKFRENALSVSGLTLKNFAKSDIAASGGIDNIRDLSGMTLNLDVNSRDVQALAKAVGADASGLPKDFGSASVKAKLTGSANAMDMTANIAAMNGELITQGKVRTPMKTPELSDMTVQLKHKNMAEALQKFTGTAEQDPNFKKPMDVYAKISQNGQVYTLAGLKGDLAGFTVQGDAKVDLSGAKPYLSGELKFGKIVLASSVTTGNPAKQNTSERWSKETIDTAGFHAVNADVNISAASILYGPWPLEAPAMKVSLKDGVLEITDMQAGLFDGRIALASTVKSVNQPRQPIHIAAKSSLTDVSVGKLVKALAGSQMIDLSGKVSTDMDILTSGTSPAALVYDLGGQGTVNGSNIVLNGVDVTRFAKALSDETKPGDSLLGLWKGTTKGGKTSFDTLEGNYVIKDGVVNIEKLDLDGPEANIATTGTVNLPQWTLSTKHKITVKPKDDVPSDVPPFEMAFSGPLDNPAQTFGQGVLQDYLNRKINRKFEKLLTDKLGLPGGEDAKKDKTQPQEVLPGSGEEQPQEIAPKKLSPEDILQQVLEPPTAQEQQPAEQEQAQQQPAPKKQEKPKDLEPEDVVKDVLKGLLH